MGGGRQSPGSSSSSSGEERSRLEACRSVCAPVPIPSQAKKTPLPSSKKRGRDAYEKGSDSRSSYFNEPRTDNGLSEAFRAKAAELLEKHVNIRFDFGGTESDEEGLPYSKDENKEVPYASVTANSAKENFKLFVDSRPGVVISDSSSRKVANGRVRPIKSGQSDDSSDDSELERMARIKTVVVDRPLPPPRTKKAIID